MIKRLSVLCFLLLALCLPACGGECQHQWFPANCEMPAFCTLCGVTEGEALSHIWQDADCETAKTCTVCGKTEGTALGHSWQEATCLTAKMCTVCHAVGAEAPGHTMQPANFQEVATCTACGYTEGQLLPPAYAAYPVTVIQAQMGTEYDYETACYVGDNTTVGKLTWENYRVFASDDTHEAAEGYVWHSVSVNIVYSDKNAQKYGFIVQSALDDYYWVQSEAGDGYTNAFAVNFHGIVYDQCLMANSVGTMSDWENKSCTYTAEFAWRVPENYDGFLVLFYNAGASLSELLASGDDALLAFRFA